MKIFFSILLVILAVAGIADASFITYSESTGYHPPCRPPFDCGAVLNSPWSHIGPVPLSVVGIFFYTCVLVIALLSYFDMRILRPLPKVRFYSEDIMAFLATCGALFSLYLVTMMGLILHAWCLYCLISAVNCMLIFLTAWTVRSLFVREREKPTFSFWRNAFRTAYLYIAKPVFFLFDAEFVHEHMVSVGSFLGQFPFTRFCTKRLFAVQHRKLQRKIDGIVFPNRVGLSAGFDYNADLTQVLPAVGFGFMTIGTVTYGAYAGNTRPRLGRYPHSQALLVNKGFKNIGVKKVVAKLRGKTFQIPVGISIGSTNTVFASLSEQIADILAAFRVVESSTLQHAYYELNISCPNTKGGQPFTTKARLEQLLKKFDTLKISRPVYIKMPIDLPDDDTIALLDCASVHQISGVIFGNLTKDKTNPDIREQDRTDWQKRSGNLSGKPTWNRSNHFIALTKKRYKKRFTIIGTGGIFSPQDAQTKMELGADLVQLITGMIFEGPQLIGEINEYLAQVS